MLVQKGFNNKGTMVFGGAVTAENFAQAKAAIEWGKILDIQAAPERFFNSDHTELVFLQASNGSFNLTKIQSAKGIQIVLVGVETQEGEKFSASIKTEAQLDAIATRFFKEPDTLFAVQGGSYTPTDGGDEKATPSFLFKRVRKKDSTTEKTETAEQV